MRNPKQLQKLTTKIYHGQHAATTNVGYTDHLKRMLNGIQKKDIGEKAKYVKQILPDKNTSHNGHDDQNWEIRNTSIDHTKHGKYDVDIIRKPNQKIFGQRIYRDRRGNNSTCHHRIKIWIFKIYQLQA